MKLEICPNTTIFLSDKHREELLIRMVRKNTVDRETRATRITNQKIESFSASIRNFIHERKRFHLSELY